MPVMIPALVRRYACMLGHILGVKQLKWTLFVLLTLGVLAGHQTLGVMDRDEARFAQSSKQMAQSGDIITPRFQDELRAKKPAGIYWFQTASAKIFGDGNIAAYRLPSLLALLISLILIYRLAGQLFPSAADSVRLLAAGFLGSGLVVIGEAHLSRADGILLLFCLWQQKALFSIYASRDANRGDKTANRPYGQFWLAMAFGILIKGPITPVLAALTIIGLLLFDRRAGWLKQLKPVFGLTLVVAICLPWAVAVQMATGNAFLDTAIGEDFLPKLVSVQQSHGGPPGTYLLLLGLLFFPASLFLGWIGRLGRDAWRTDSIKFLVAWSVGYWLVAELIPTKLPHYILPVLPAVSLLLAAAMMAPASKVAPKAASKTKSKKGLMSWLTARWQRIIEDGLALWAALAGLVFVGTLSWGAITLGGVTGGRAFLAVLVVAGLMLAVGVCFIRLRLEETSPKRHRKMLQLLVMGGLINIVAIGGVIASLDRLHMSGKLAEVIGTLETQPAMIALVGYHEPSAVFTLGTDVLLLSGSEAALLLIEADDVLIIIEEETLPEFNDVMNQLGLYLDPIRQLEGVNMSKGTDSITLYLFQGSSRLAN